MSEKNNISIINDLVLYEKKNVESLNHRRLLLFLLDEGPLSIKHLVNYYQKFDPSADVKSVEKDLSLWSGLFEKTENGLWKGIPQVKKYYNNSYSGKKSTKKQLNRPDKFIYEWDIEKKPLNDQRVYNKKNNSHFLLSDTDTYKRIGPYLKVEAKDITVKEKDAIAKLMNKEDLLQIFLKRNDRYIFFGHRLILNYDEAPDGKTIILKFAPAKDDLSIYQLEDKSAALIDYNNTEQYPLALPFEAPNALPPAVVKKIEADYSISKGTSPLFFDRYKDKSSRLKAGSITPNEFLNWLGDEKSTASQKDFERVLSQLIFQNTFKDKLQILDIALQCVNNESSIEFCDDFLYLIIKNRNPEPEFKYKANCFIDVMLLSVDKLEVKHYRKIAKAYAQFGEWNPAVKYYSLAYSDGITANDIDMEFRVSLEKCDYEDMKDSIDILFNAGLRKAFDDKINDENSEEVFDLVISFYQFYKDKVRPEQNDLEAFASSVLTTCAINNEWDNFDLFFDDIEAREKFMKKPEKKFDLLSVGEMSGTKDFISGLSGKYMMLINKNFDKITEILKKDLVEQVRIFESLMGNSDSSLSDWLQRLRKESKSNESKIETKDILKGLKNIFIIGGREETRKTIEKRLLGCGADKVESVPPMSEKHMDKQSLRSKMSSFDCVVLLTNFMGHAESYMGKDVAGEKGIQVVHCHGGISKLLVELGKLKR